MAPADHSHAFRINLSISLQHELPSGFNVFDFPPPLVNRPPEKDAINAAAAIVRSNHSIALLQQFPDDDAEIIGSHVPVNFRMSQNDQWQFMSSPFPARHEGQRRNDDVIAS